MAVDVTGYLLGNGKGAKLAKKYGVEGPHMGHPDGRSGKPNRSIEQVERETAAKMANDYDVRRSIEAAQLAGNKKAQKLGSGISNMEEALAAEKFMKKTHKNRMGNGGEYASANDAGNVTKYWVNKDRDNQTAAYDEAYAKTTDLNSLKNKFLAQATSKAAGAPIEPSDRMAAVEDRLEGASYNTPPGLHDKNNTDPAKADDQKDAARNFLSEYKLDVTKGAGIKHDIKTSISNAAQHVTDPYGR
jgi:hypothetical protein